jgi:hypothetical protein
MPPEFERIACAAEEYRIHRARSAPKQKGERQGGLASSPRDDLAQSARGSAEIEAAAGEGSAPL